MYPASCVWYRASGGWSLEPRAVSLCWHPHIYFFLKFRLLLVIKKIFAILDCLPEYALSAGQFPWSGLAKALVSKEK